jgi:glutathione S-transferase
MPKPDLVPLTGGYRRIPVMQIGADVFCDSQVILAEIERRHPEPKALLGPSFAINLWAVGCSFRRRCRCCSAR